MQKMTRELSARMANMGFLCACLVVLIHCTPATETGSLAWWYCHFLGREGICVVAVPYFFLAAGFFLAGKIGAKGWWKGETLKRVRTLLVPFAMWIPVYQIYSLSVWYLKSRVFHLTVGTNSWLIDPWMCLVKLSGFHPFADLGVFWFIRCLFALVIISPVIVFCLRKSKTVTLSILVILHLVTSWHFGCMGWNFYSFFDRFVTVRGALYFSLGLALRMSDREWSFSIENKLLLAVVGVAMLVAKNIATLYAMHSVSFVLEALSVPCLMVSIFALLSERHWPNVLTDNSFAIFLIHNIFLSLTSLGFIVVGIYGNLTWQIPMMYLRFGVAVIASIALAVLARKCLPRVAAMMLGGR